MHLIHFAYGSTPYGLPFDPWIDKNTLPVVMNDEICYFGISTTFSPQFQKCVHTCQQDNLNIKALHIHFLLTPRTIRTHHLLLRTTTFGHITLPPPFHIDPRNASTHTSRVTSVWKPYVYTLARPLIQPKWVSHCQKRRRSVILPSHPPSCHAQVILCPKNSQLWLTPPQTHSPNLNIVHLAWQSQKPCLHGQFLIFCLISSSPHAQVILCPKGCQLQLTLPKIDSPNSNIVHPGWQSQKPCLHDQFFIFCPISSSPHT